MDQLWPLAIAWAEVDTSGLMARVSGTSRAIASASAKVMVLALPRPELTPPVRRLPAKTVSKFWPSAATWEVIRVCAPLPTATMATTEATPMIMPSAVRLERILLRRSARRAMNRVCHD